MNLGTYQVFDGFAQVGRGRIQLSREALASLKAEDKNSVVLGFRPESLDRSTANAEGAIPIEVDIVEELGSDAYVYGSVPNEFGESKEIHFAAGESQMVVRIDPRDVPKKGDTVWVTIREGEQHTFSSATGKRLTKDAVITGRFAEALVPHAFQARGGSAQAGPPLVFCARRWGWVGPTLGPV